MENSKRIQEKPKIISFNNAMFNKIPIILKIIAAIEIIENIKGVHR